MNNIEVAEYVRSHYGREEYLLLTLVSCSLLLGAVKERHSELPPEIAIIEDALTGLRESLDEKELLTVSMMMAEINRLQDEPDEAKT